MRFASAVSTEHDSTKGLDRVIPEILDALGGEDPDLACVFLTPHHIGDAVQISERLRRELGTDHLVGSTGAGILAAGREIEESPGIGVMAGALPGAGVRTLHLTQEDLEATETPADWHERLEIEPAEAPSFVVLPDPYSIDAERLLAGLDGAYPGRPKVGGVASGGTEPGTHALFCGEEVHDAGATMLALTGAVEIRPMVSQGCRPIGDRFVITKGEENVIRQLAGRPALEVIQETLSALKGRDQTLARGGLLIGRVVDEAKSEFHRGDFLVRGIAGADRETGAVAVGDIIKRGITVQLQVRDAKTADEDLREMLAHNAGALRAKAPGGAFLFSCNGRGRGMYGDADHDSRVLREALPGLPLAGFFCNGEVGPIGPRTFLHGFTSAIGFLAPRDA